MLNHRSPAVLGIPCLCLLLVAGSAPASGEVRLPRSGEPQQLSRIDKDLVDDISRRSFRYFWEQQDLRTGLVADRALTTGEAEDHPRHERIASIAATGFGLTALCIAADHRWIGQESARQ